MMMSTGEDHSRAWCSEADARDPLAGFRSEFDLPDGVIYLDGNSLGAMPRRAVARAGDVVSREWGADLIGSWNSNGWFDLPTRIGDKIAELIGGGEGTCVATDTTSVNVFKAVAAALHIQAEAAPERRVVVSERDNFPTDLYIVEGLLALLGERYSLRLVDTPEDLGAALGDDVAAVLLTQVNYRTGALWDIESVTEQAHRAGALVIWDLCHSAGALPISIAEAGADFAVGCTYKYLNGGPGSPAFIWCAPRHREAAVQPLSGWWGHRSPFEMAGTFAPAEGIRRFLVGTQPIVSLATMEVGIDLALRADQHQLRAKSMALTSLFIDLVEQRLAAHPLTLITPRDPQRRGSHVSYVHPEGYAVMRALIARGVIGDYREPGVLRFGFAPLYNGYRDVWDAVETLRAVLDDEIWRAPEYRLRGAVT